MQGRDLGHLRIVAELWGVELSAPDARLGIQQLALILLDAELAEEVIDALPAGAQQALQDLLPEKT